MQVGYSLSADRLPPATAAIKVSAVGESRKAKADKALIES
jgi:hypothetical protein